MSVSIDSGSVKPRRPSTRPGHGAQEEDDGELDLEAELGRRAGRGRSAGRRLGRGRRRGRIGRTDRGTRRWSTHPTGGCGGGGTVGIGS